MSGASKRDQWYIDPAGDDPFYGFNEGSTYVTIGAVGEPHFEFPVSKAVT